MTSLYRTQGGSLAERLGPTAPDAHDHWLPAQMRMRLSCHAAMAAWQPRGQVPRLRLYLPDTVTPGTENADATWRDLSISMTVGTIPGDHESMLTACELVDAVAATTTTPPSSAVPR